MSPLPEAGPARGWTLAVLAAAAPVVLVLCSVLWRMPFPIGDSVGIFEDIEGRAASSFLLPTSSYYRPLFYLALSAIWHSAPTLDAALTTVRLLHIVPVLALAVLFVWHLRPRSALDAAAAAFGLAVLFGSPGLLGNLEPPLSYTIVGMAAALVVWMLLEATPRRWHGAAIVAVTLAAIGFKEQGLVLAPAVVVAWWMGAPGAGRRTAAAVTAIAASYVVFRLAYHDSSLPQFEQDVGLGFGVLSPPEAAERFGEFPLWVYAYSAASTIGNVLFAEPTEGVFRFTRALVNGATQPWHVVYVASSVCLTALVVWWGARELRRRHAGAWSPEARLFAVTLVVVLASGALSFNYSRDRLGGMAVPFYALAAAAAVRAAGARAARARLAPAVAGALCLAILGGAWQLRALYTVEFTRQRAVNTHREWITHLRRREREFANRPVYLRIMHGMSVQGTAPHAIRRTHYPRWIFQLLGEY